MTNFKFKPDTSDVSTKKNVNTLSNGIYVGNVVPNHPEYPTYLVFVYNGIVMFYDMKCDDGNDLFSHPTKGPVFIYRAQKVNLDSIVGTKQES